MWVNQLMNMVRSFFLSGCVLIQLSSVIQPSRSNLRCFQKTFLCHCSCTEDYRLLERHKSYKHSSFLRDTATRSGTKLCDWIPFIPGSDKLDCPNDLTPLILIPLHREGELFCPRIELKDSSRLEQTSWPVLLVIINLVSHCK